MTRGGLVDVYPVPGFVIAILTIFPPLIVAVPMFSLLVPVSDVVATPTLTVV